MKGAFHPSHNSSNELFHRKLEKLSSTLSLIKVISQIREWERAIPKTSEMLYDMNLHNATIHGGYEKAFLFIYLLSRPVLIDLQKVHQVSTDLLSPLTNITISFAKDKCVIGKQTRGQASEAILSSDTCLFNLLLSTSEVRINNMADKGYPCLIL